ncbi:hypothetical protein AYI70_g2079 [Smittium culicis]|uniref:Uncharacterized protein n=1 Tax=Smittium culicis TaxID=133412 RepID=A0A1R1YA21_9FUNG|nr:hypothetical protein AYI70_g2079 [Smittium culicis]
MNFFKKSSTKSKIEDGTLNANPSQKGTSYFGSLSKVYNIKDSLKKKRPGLTISSKNQSAFQPEKSSGLEDSTTPVNDFELVNSVKPTSEPQKPKSSIINKASFPFLRGIYKSKLHSSAVNMPSQNQDNTEYYQTTGDLNRSTNNNTDFNKRSSLDENATDPNYTEYEAFASRKESDNHGSQSSSRTRTESVISIGEASEYLLVNQDARCSGDSESSGLDKSSPTDRDNKQKSVINNGLGITDEDQQEDEEDNGLASFRLSLNLDGPYVPRPAPSPVPETPSSPGDIFDLGSFKMPEISLSPTGNSYTAINGTNADNSPNEKGSPSLVDDFTSSVFASIEEASKGPPRPALKLKLKNRKSYNSSLQGSAGGSPINNSNSIRGIKQTTPISSMVPNFSTVPTLTLNGPSGLTKSSKNNSRPNFMSPVYN